MGSYCLTGTVSVWNVAKGFGNGCEYTLWHGIVYLKIVHNKYYVYFTTIKEVISYSQFKKTSWKEKVQ